MRETTFIIMTALAGHRLHGYGIIQAAADLSGGRVQLGPGTLYGALDRLVESGLVHPDGEETRNGRFRRYYRLTEQGEQTLGKEADRMAANVRNARRRLSATALGRLA
jgi:DNA-binding PadR family transcriptional regulator